MCNLYDLDVAPPFLKDRFRLKRAPDAAASEKSGAVGMVRPSVKAPVIHLDADGQPVCSFMEWGFVRQWKNEAGKLTLHRLFNVRSETIDSKPTFAPAYRGTRAIIPASGYYELPEKGVRIRITKQDGDVLAFAGLWERALHPKTGEEITAFTMAMTNGNGFTSAFHDRMPCLLEDSAFKAWLDATRVDAKKFLVPYPRDDLIAERKLAPAREGNKSEPAPRGDRLL
jgi:putative SOS response-associated peptidase YedK